jgi:replication-associated recombination protein RarA
LANQKSINVIKGKIMSFTEKYKPQNLGQCLYPDQATEDLIRDFATNAIDSSLVLYGPMGTGKSLMAKLIEDSLRESGAAWPETFQGTTLQTASKSDAVAERIEKLSCLSNFLGDRKLFVIEEFDMIKLDNQMAFSYLMDTAGVQFILTTNEVQDIDKRILSRAQVCHISGATQNDMLKLAQHVVASEGVTATQSELNQLTVSSAGNVRDLMRGLEGLVLRKRRQLAQTAAIQVVTLSGLTSAQAQPILGSALTPSSLPTVSFISPNAPLGQPTP